MELEATIRKATIGFKSNGQRYLAGRITSKKLIPFINQKVKIKIEVLNDEIKTNV